jgi:hypothetical protein
MMTVLDRYLHTYLRDCCCELGNGLQVCLLFIDVYTDLQPDLQVLLQVYKKERISS